MQKPTSTGKDLFRRPSRGWAKCCLGTSKFRLKDKDLNPCLAHPKIKTWMSALKRKFSGGFYDLDSKNLGVEEFFSTSNFLSVTQKAALSTTQLTNQSSKIHVREKQKGKK